MGRPLDVPQKSYADMCKNKWFCQTPPVRVVPPKFSSALRTVIFYGKKSIETTLDLHPHNFDFTPPSNWKSCRNPWQECIPFATFWSRNVGSDFSKFGDNETSFKTKLKERHPDWCFTRIFSLTRNKFRESTFTHSHRQPPLPSYILIFIPISTWARCVNASKN